MMGWNSCLWDISFFIIFIYGLFGQDKCPIISLNLYVIFMGFPIDSSLYIV